MFLFSCIELRVAFELKLMLETYKESWVERLLRPVTEENAFKHEVFSPYDRRFNLRLTFLFLAFLVNVDVRKITYDACETCSISSMFSSL